MDSIVIDAGERYDFILEANQSVSSYWVRLHGLMDCTPRRVFQGAILRYESAPEVEPEETLTFENTKPLGKVRILVFKSEWQNILNCLKKM